MCGIDFVQEKVEEDEHCPECKNIIFQGDAKLGE
jgi:hypothetical protein